MMKAYLYDSLCHHCFGNFQESCYVCTLYIVYVAISFRTIFHTVSVNVIHDVVHP